MRSTGLSARRRAGQSLSANDPFFRPLPPGRQGRDGPDCAGSAGRTGGRAVDVGRVRRGPAANLLQRPGAGRGAAPVRRLEGRVHRHPPRLPHRPAGRQRTGDSQSVVAAWDLAAARPASGLAAGAYATMFLVTMGIVAAGCPPAHDPHRPAAAPARRSSAGSPASTATTPGSTSIELSALTDQDEVDEVGLYIVDASTIAAVKHRLVRRATQATVPTVALWALLVVVLVCAGHVGGQRFRGAQLLRGGNDLLPEGLPSRLELLQALEGVEVLVVQVFDPDNALLGGLAEGFKDQFLIGRDERVILRPGPFRPGRSRGKGPGPGRR